jgi:hypothetical protein
MDRWNKCRCKEALARKKNLTTAKDQCDCVGGGEGKKLEEKWWWQEKWLGFHLDPLLTAVAARVHTMAH